MGPWEACFGAELDWEKLWRDQVFGAKVRSWEACFGPELDWEKLWRDQVFGVKMTETNAKMGDKWTTNFFFSREKLWQRQVLGSQSATMGGLFWTRIRLGKAVAGPGVRG